MACLFTTGIARDCGYNFGGLSGLWLIPKSKVTTIGKDASNIITGITTSGSSKFLKFEFEPNTGQLLQELQSGTASKYFQQTINSQYANISQAKKEVLEDVGNSETVALCKYQNGKYVLAGETGRGLLATTLSNDSGTAEADAAIVTLGLVGGSLEMANEVSSSIVSSLVNTL